MSDFAILGTVAHQVPLSIGFSRQEYWSGLSCPPPGALQYPGTEPMSPVSLALQAYSLPTEPPGKPRTIISKKENVSYMTSTVPRTHNKH